MKEKIAEDMKSAMKAKESVKLATVRLLLAAIKQKEIDERVTLDDSAIVAVIDKLIKQRRDSTSIYEKAGRLDLAEREQAEVSVLANYLPARLTQAEIAAEVKAIARELGANNPSDMGRVMALTKVRLLGKADMKSVSEAIKQTLGAA